MNKKIRIRNYFGHYYVQVQRKFLWIFSSWRILYSSYSLELCEKFYNELKEGKHKELL